MKNRTAFVTGGTGGIGTTICRHLVSAGVRVVAGYHSGGNHDKAKAWQKEQREAGYDVGIVFGNVREFESCKASAEAVVAQVGHVDILVNNAGVTRDAMFYKMEHEQWHDVITANLNSLYHITRLVINPMIERKHGRIINISSVNAQKGQLGQTNYSAAKAGMHGFTKALAQEVARHGITVNTVSPGYIATKMVMAVPEKVREAIIANIPVGRLGTPDEVARVVTFLAADTAGYITGSNISVNGGQHMF
ncbi:MAG: acetoacetyl-CoA reductase [Deferrisomatales bacterium]|nr:acetoacetyl-CoA reductase [Deferrisomatales bacterium]